MFRNGPRRGRGRRQRGRQITTALRTSRQLPVQIGYFRTKNPRPLISPPTYVEDTRYSRIIRIVHTFTGTTAVDLTVTTGMLKTSASLTNFSRMHVTMIKAYGVNHYITGATNITLAPRVRVRTFVPGSSPFDRDFEDIGVAGAQVAQISLSAHGSQFPYTNDTTSVLTAFDIRDSLAAGSNARVVLDFHCTFFDTAVTTDSTKILELCSALDGLTESFENLTT